jgi:protein-tyrosine phosphatase
LGEIVHSLSDGRWTPERESRAEGIGLSTPVIDLHCHVLPGIDDGPKTVEDSLAIARAAAAAGTRTVVATSHVSWEYPNRAETIARLVDDLNHRLSGDGLALEIRRGAEIAMTRLPDMSADELSQLTLGGGRWLLVEPPFTLVATGLDVLIAGLRDREYQVVLAHPERCPAFHRDRSMLEQLVDSGVLTSVTAGSLDGRFGRDVRRFSLELVRDRLVHNVASDAHDVASRPPTIAAELQRAGLGSLAGWLTDGVPRAILDGADIPPRPEVELPALQSARRTRWLRRWH